MEAEALALATATKHAVKIRDILDELGNRQERPTPIQQDNQSLLAALNKVETTGSSKHVRLRIDYVADQIKLGTVKPHYVATDNILADYLTKPLTALFTTWRESIMNMYRRFRG